MKNLESILGVQSHENTHESKTHPGRAIGTRVREDVVRSNHPLSGGHLWEIP